MRNRDFNDPGQARNYMSNCIIRVADEPVLVHDVIGEGKNMTLSCSNLDDIRGRATSVKIKDKTIDMNPVQLGMCMYFDGEQYRTFFVSRFPARIWRVGLARDNISISYLLGKGEASDYTESIFASKSMSDCIKGKYSSLKDIHEMFQNHPGTIPFSRRFAIDHGGRVYYKTLPYYVGVWTHPNGVKLSADFTYLAEVLQEDAH